MARWEKPHKFSEIVLEIPNDCSYSFHSISQITNWFKMKEWKATIVDNPMSRKYRIAANTKNISNQFRNRSTLKIDIYMPSTPLSVHITRAYLRII